MAFDCTRTRELMHPLLDGELPPAEAESLRRHIESCAACREELQQSRELSAQLASLEEQTRADVPAELWSAIERRLISDSPQTKLRSLTPRMLRLYRLPLALAASFAILVGLGLLFSLTLDRGAQSASAATIDYSILMDRVDDNAHAAIHRFLTHYDALRIEPGRVHAAAPDLSFDLPATLPGDYRLVQAYRLKFSQSPGVAAVYERDGEPLFVLFHPMADNTTGPHGVSCRIGDLHGSEIQVGDWRLLHIMDQTTCHCVLTKLNPGPELASIVRAVAPGMESHAEPAHVH